MSFVLACLIPFLAVASGAAQTLHDAAVKGDTNALIAQLASGADVNANNEWAMTPLMAAAQSGHWEAARALLEAGADVNAANKDGWTPLIFAARGGHKEAAKGLLAAGADINAANKYDHTPLVMAALSGNAELVAVLLAAGADLKREDARGKIPLIEAASYGHTKVVESLLAAGANVNAANWKRETALFCATKENHAETAAVLQAAGGRMLAPGDFLVTYAGFQVGLRKPYGDLSGPQTSAAKASGYKRKDRVWLRIVGGDRESEVVPPAETANGPTLEVIALRFAVSQTDGSISATYIAETSRPLETELRQHAGSLGYGPAEPVYFSWKAPLRRENVFGQTLSHDVMTRTVATMMKPSEKPAPSERLTKQ